MPLRLEGRYLVPDWPAPATIRARVSTRIGSLSCGPYAGFNVATHVGDDPERVAACRAQLATELGWTRPAQWLEQVHGTDLVEALADSHVPEADACFSREPGQPCVVMTADCLPVLFTCRDGTQVAAAHAGWRGLCQGVLEATLASFACSPDEVLVWLGPAIGPEQFEVGNEVRAAFIAAHAQAYTAFRPSERAGHWLADLYQLARLRLARAGCHAVYGGGFCTYRQSDLFYSYRRTPVTGRMASMIWRIA